MKQHFGDRDVVRKRENGERGIERRRAEERGRERELEREKENILLIEAT